MSSQFLNGRIKRHPDGFGFFIPEQSEHPDVYIPRQSMSGAMTNDQVKIQVFPERGSQRFRGDIIEILQRAQTSVVGKLQKWQNDYIVQDEGKGWGEDLKIESKHISHAKVGDLVSVEITSYPGERAGFRGKVSDVLGDSMDPLTDTKRVLFQNQIPQEFPPAVMSETKSFTEKVPPEDYENRKDIRHLNFVTIDGATAKDFDDAIYIENNSEGFLLYVAIADVSHYVKENSAIDKEAYSRGTSVYFPNFVVPMLPEILSNGLCSLNPHLPRLALVAEIQLDYTGEPLRSSFYEAVFESKARVTYGEAQEIIEGGDLEKLKHVKKDILRAADLAKILMAKRFQNGSLDLEIPEVQIVLDTTGMPTDFIRSNRLFAHRLIEEMMLAANVAVAKFLSDSDEAGMYRIHEPPNKDAISMLENYLQSFGSKVSLDQGKLQKRLTKALQEFSGKPEAEVLNILALRSMSQAKYSADNLGHFGLGFEHYTHFTSPIRRYPDLIVHRLIKSKLRRKLKTNLSNQEYQLDEDYLRTSATILSAAEQRSVKAERQFQAIKKARFMQKHLGEEFDGIISSVTKFGVFVLLRQFEVDGLVRLENLSREKLEFDEDTLTLVGSRTGQIFKLGDPLKIQVAAADPDAGQVDFALAESDPHFVEGRSLASLGRSKRNPGSDKFKRPTTQFKEHKRKSLDSKKEKEKKSWKKDQEQKSSGKRKDFDSKLKVKNKNQNNLGRSKKAEPAESETLLDRPRFYSKFQKNEKSHKAPVSKKLQAAEKIEAKTEQKSKTKGGFDPETHLKNAIESWKKRSDISAGRNLRKKK